jgi:preprotein translocase subunit SecA
MEHLRDGIGLRGYGQRDPKNEYKKEGYNLFLNMMASVSSNVLAKLFDAKVRRNDDIAAMEAEAEHRHQHELEAAVARHVGEDDDQTVDPATQLARMRASAESAPQSPPTQAAPRIGRNDPCPCGSGKKFKKCHGAALEDDAEGEEQPTA